MADAVQGRAFPGDALLRRGTGLSATALILFSALQLLMSMALSVRCAVTLVAVTCTHLMASHKHTEP